jgi:hypothetical protein
MLTTTKSISYNLGVRKYIAEILTGAFKAKRAVVSVPTNRWVCDTVNAYPSLNYLEVYSLTHLQHGNEPLVNARLQQRHLS